MDERVAQYLRLYSCLFQTTVGSARKGDPPPQFLWLSGEMMETNIRGGGDPVKVKLTEIWPGAAERKLLALLGRRIFQVRVFVTLASPAIRCYSVATLKLRNLMMVDLTFNFSGRQT